MNNHVLKAIALSGAVLALCTLVLGCSPDSKSQDIPRLADGKPDFNGIWDRPRVGNITMDVEGCGSGSVGCSSKSSGQLSFTPAGLAAHEGPKIDYPARCLPWGYTWAYHTTYPIMYMQTAKVFAVLFESNNIFHIVPTDGREHPDEVESTWMGKSFGRYEGDTLVINSRGFNGLSWIDNGGEHPVSETMQITERISHIDADTLRYQITLVDPKFYTEPIVNDRVFVRMPDDTELYEYWCMENNKALMDGLLPDTIFTE